MRQKPHANGINDGSHFYRAALGLHSVPNFPRSDRGSENTVHVQILSPHTTSIVAGGIMIKQSKDQQPLKPNYSHPSPLDEANKQRRQAEVKEVAGRHNNSGQKGHRGSR